jgi:DNA-binding NtrC family response regulator
VSRGKILIVEGDANFRLSIREVLQVQDYEVHEAESCRAALCVFQSIRPDVVVADYSLQDGNALELLPRLKILDPNLCFLILARHGTIDLAVQAIKAGAEQFLMKPVELPSFITILQQILEHRRHRMNRLVGQRRRPSQSLDPFLGTSPAVRALAQKVKKLLSTDNPILIQGETGTGKGVLATWLHYHSPRQNESFVDLNCATLSRELLESDLFGHERGAFTGAVTPKKGLLEVANGGTVFLDEIGDMDPQVQPKLLKVLEEKSFRRLGDTRNRGVDIRLITASHKSLTLLIRENIFREDLYYRISTFTLNIPPLRERVEDIPILARQILADIATQFGGIDIKLSPETERFLKLYSWPGNIRELRNVLERATTLSDYHIIYPQDLHDIQFSNTPPVSHNRGLTLLELERRHIVDVLQSQHGHVEEAARLLGLSRSTLYLKIKKHNINLSSLNWGKKTHTGSKA